MSGQEIEATCKCCPRCKSDDVREIVYGLVSDPTHFAGEAVALGGCCVHPGESPMWRCGNCGHEWGVAPLVVEAAKAGGDRLT